MPVYSADGKDCYTVNVNYKVRKGDTLTDISKATGIPVQVLANDNKIKNPNCIFVGQTIALRYHPDSEECFNSETMNQMYPNMADQARYFDEVDYEQTARYNAVNKHGAQEYNRLNRKG